MSKLWSKGYELDALMEEFTVGDDYILDKRLIPSDVLGSMAHAVMLRDIGLLESSEEASLHKGLLVILEEHEKGEFLIQKSDEDGHTAIENRLVLLAGDAGKRIHLGRSRNDQVLTVTRIWMRQYLMNLVSAGAVLVSELLNFAEKNKNVPMPGRTHMQPAMPSSVGLWAGGFAEQLLDDVKGAASLFPRFDQCPLGSAAGYGTSLPLDREKTAELLGFSRVQVNTAYCGLSRGKFESTLLDALDQIALTLSKMAQDLILFSMPEFGWFTLPQELCTGSSIMPQKRNPDGLELMRAKSASVGAWAQQVKAVIRSLPSGYNRDYQDTKGPLMQG
ncbi:MAG: argininosuccinate lyase, partial [Spirochaetaceae bacterium]|nr:argininosuccinate lyase [Spirochaetaceae bacterium]